MSKKNKIFNVTHPSIAKMTSQLKRNRDCVFGSSAVKSGAATYLPMPETMPSGKYKSYLDNANYTPIPSQTLDSLVGAFSSNPVTIQNLPEKLSYLENDVDGSGTSLKTIINQTVSNILQVKWHVVTCVYSTELQRSVFSTYPRESVLDYAFGIRNGVNQLIYVKLLEKYSVFNLETHQHEEQQRNLVYALDKDGNCYTQEITQDDKQSEKVYLKAGKDHIKRLPLEIISDTPVTNSIPTSSGYITPIVDKTLELYKNSANLEHDIAKTSHSILTVTGLPKTEEGEYQEVNLKGMIPLEDNGKITPVQFNSSGSVLFTQRDVIIEDLKSLGGRFNVQDNSKEAVGIAQIQDRKELTVLNSIVDNITSSFQNLLQLASSFDHRENTEKEELTIVINKEFNKVKMTPQEVNAIQQLYLNGIIDEQEALSQLKEGGRLIGNVEDILSNITGN